MTLAILIFVSYTIVAANTVAIAHKQYGRTAVSSILFMLVNFYVTKHIVEANSTYELILYVIGGTAGDMAGIWVSKFLDRRSTKSES